VGIGVSFRLDTFYREDDRGDPGESRQSRQIAIPGTVTLLLLIEIRQAGRPGSLRPSLWDLLPTYGLLPGGRPKRCSKGGTTPTATVLGEDHPARSAWPGTLPKTWAR
jgi:hypothetical protein